MTVTATTLPEPFGAAVAAAAPPAGDGRRAGGGRGALATAVVTTAPGEGASTASGALACTGKPGVIADTGSATASRDWVAASAGGETGAGIASFIPISAGGRTTACVGNPPWEVTVCSG